MTTQFFPATHSLLYGHYILFSPLFSSILTLFSPEWQFHMDLKQHDIRITSDVHHNKDITTHWPVITQETMLSCQMPGQSSVPCMKTTDVILGCQISAITHLRVVKCQNDDQQRKTEETWRKSCPCAPSFNINITLSTATKPQFLW